MEYSIDNGTTWSLIIDDVYELPYNWQVPMVASSQCLIRATHYDKVDSVDVSDDTFTIYQCQLDSAADLNNDCKVTMPDLAITSADWSDVYDLADLIVLADDWLRNGNPFDPGYTEAP